MEVVLKPGREYVVKHASYRDLVVINGTSGHTSIKGRYLGAVPRQRSLDRVIYIGHNSAFTAIYYCPLQVAIAKISY